MLVGWEGSRVGGGCWVGVGRVCGRAREGRRGRWWVWHHALIPSRSSANTYTLPQTNMETHIVPF